MAAQTQEVNSRARSRRPMSVQTRRVLIVANQTATSQALISALREISADGPVCLRLVVPALNRRLQHWVSDIDAALSAAHLRADEAEEVLKDHGLTVRVEIGDSVPLVAIDDALARFDADEIVISTLPPSQSHWLEHNLIEDTRERLAIPVRHVVASERKELAA